MFYFNNSHTAVPQPTLENIYQQYRICDDARPSGIFMALSEHLDHNWHVIFDKKARDMLSSLTTHRRHEKIRRSFVEPARYNHEKSASYEFNLFISNIRAYGLDAAFAHINQRNLNRVRVSKGHDNVFHNHFGSNPEYVFEYQVYREERVVVVKKIFSHESNDFLQKAGPLSDYQRELDEEIERLDRKNAGRSTGPRKILLSALQNDLHMNQNPDELAEQKANNRAKLAARQ